MTHSITRAVPEPGPCDTAALACAIDLALYTGSCTPQPPSETEHVRTGTTSPSLADQLQPLYVVDHGISKGFVTLRHTSGAHAD